MKVRGSELSHGIDLHHLPAGLYLIKGESGVHNAFARIMKL